MIRFINCVRRRKDISVDEFRRYWNSPEFEYLFERLFIIVQPKRFSKNLTLQVSANEQIRQERAVANLSTALLNIGGMMRVNCWKNMMHPRHRI